MSLQITILGSLRVEREGTELELGGPKQRAVLAALVVERGETVSIGRLLDVVWGDEPPDQAEASLQSYVSKLRKELEPDRAPRAESTVLVTRPGGYALAVAADVVDAERFTELVRRARAAHLRADRDAALGAYDDALTMWAPPLPEFEADRFALATRLRLEELHAAAAEERIDVLLESGAHRELVGELEAAVEEYPLREHRWYQLALARYRAGQQTDALRAVARARAVLAEEAGLDAGHELARLEADLLAQSADLDAPAPSGARAVTPPGPPRSVRRHPRSARQDDATFFGRRDELSAMVDALDAAVGGSGRIVVVSGEPGIGKTRLTEEIARLASERGVVVGWARCPESAATETLRPILQLGQVLMDEGVTPQVDLDDAVGDRSEADRSSALVDAFVGAVRRLDRAPRPFMAVIDDLQWADPSSLRVIEHGAADLANVPILLVVTVRPPEAAAPAALVDCLGELARQPGASRLGLGGLGAEDVRSWIEARRGSEPEDGLAEFVHDRTDGNPFFVQELVALLAEQHSDVSGGVSTTEVAGVGPAAAAPAVRRAAVPGAVADVIRRRVSRLPPSTQQLLPVAAVVGRSFDADVAATISDRTTGELLDDLDAAIDAGLVLEDPEVVGRFRFSHALVADALVAELSAARRARVHAATARALEDLRIASLDQHLAEVAHHALAGALAGTAELAQRYSDLAAERAERVGAFEDEAQHRATALRALELARPGDREARYAALVRLGVARRHSDDAAGAISAFADAIAVAEELGDLEAMGTAAVLLNEPSPWQSGDYGSPNSIESAVVERVLDRLPDGDSTVRAELLGALAAFAYYRDPVQSERLSADAVAMARRLGDPVTLIRTLNNRAQALWRADSLGGRTAAAQEMVELASRHDLDPELQFLVEFTRMVSAAETGESPRQHLERVRQLALASGSSRALNQLGWFEAALLSIEGRDHDAIAVGAATFERYRRTRRWSAEVIHFGFVIVAHIDAGRGEQLLASVAGLPVGDYGAAFVGFAAWSLQELGQPEAARDVLGPPGAVADLRDDWMWLGANTVTALAIAEAGDVAAAEVLLARLAPYAGVIAVLGTNVGVPATDHALGRLHALLGDVEQARTHLDRAIELERRIGAVAWWSRALIARAELLADSTDPDDRAVAEADLAEARAAATAHHLVPVIERLDRLATQQEHAAARRTD